MLKRSRRKNYIKIAGLFKLLKLCKKRPTYEYLAFHLYNEKSNIKSVVIDLI